MPLENPSSKATLSSVNVQFYLLGAEGIAFCPARRQLYYLNTTAAFIWCSLEEGFTPPEIAQALSIQFPISTHQAKRDIDKALMAWASEGLRAPGSPAADGDISPEIKDSAAPISDTPPRPANPVGVSLTEPETASRELERRATEHTPAPLSVAFEEHHYRLGNLNFTVRYASAVAQASVHPVLAHLELEKVPGAVDTASHISIDIVEDGELFSLVYGGKNHGESVSDPELAPLVHQCILTMAYESSACLAAFHAGAVGNQRECILLPGTPGSGKSTLTAALVNAGLTYLTDELVLLLPDTSLCPLPISLGLKRGSWPLLTPTIPKLGRLPVHRQPDGTEVRYLSPQAAPLRGHHSSLRALVFPHYVADTSTRLTPLSTAEALYRLSVAGYAVSGELDTGLVAALIGWISRQQCYELQIGDLNSAVSVVRKLLA